MSSSPQSAATDTPARPSFARRFLFPVAVSLAFWLLLYFLNSESLRLDVLWQDNLAFYRAYKNGVLLLFYLSFVVVGAGFVYPYVYFVGAAPSSIAGLRERVLASFITPLAYIISEMVRVSDYFTPGESIYYGFSSMGLFILFLNFGLLGLSEMVCRLVSRRKTGAPTRIITLGPLASVVLAGVMIYVVLFWDMGQVFFYIYQEGYILLFP